jgi:hypothetical protein
MTLADGLGFEPKTPLRMYSISSAAPSTGLGHPSATGKVYESGSTELSDRSANPVAAPSSVRSKLVYALLSSHPASTSDAKFPPLNVSVPSQVPV